MSLITAPTREQVSPVNQGLFDELKKGIGMVPNLYATLALSEHALGSYLTLHNAMSSITGAAREVVNLVVSQVNNCVYCLAAHTVIAKTHGLSDQQILEIRRGHASFDAKLETLAVLVKSIVLGRGHADPARVRAFLDSGWSRENLVDVIVTIGDKTITNYLHGATQVPVDFPPAPALPL